MDCLLLENLIQLSALSDGTNTYQFHFGWQNSISAINPTIALLFQYSSTLNSGNWVCYANNLGATTTVNTSTAAAAGSWVKLKIVYTYSDTTARFYVNGTLVGTISTNITSNTSWQIGQQIVKSAGGTAAYFLIDYFKFRAVYAAAR